MNKTIRASDLIAELAKAIEAHGDLPIFHYDDDTEWALPYHVVHCVIPAKNEIGEAVLATSTGGYGQMSGSLTPL